jgi:hypothetical protein
MLLKHSKGDQYCLLTIVTYCNMMLVRTRQGSNTIKKIEELRLNNKMKNDETHKQQEKEEKQKKDKEDACRIQEKAEKEKEEAKTPRIFHEVLNGADPTQMETRAVDHNGEEQSHLKKQSGSSKFSTKFSGYSIQGNGF